MDSRRYDGYRGRSGAKTALKTVAVLLLVAVVLTTAVLVFGQRYIIYTDDGVRLELPFFRREPTVQPDRSVSVDIIQTRPEQTAEDQFYSE